MTILVAEFASEFVSELATEFAPELVSELATESVSESVSDSEYMQRQSVSGAISGIGGQSSSGSGMVALSKQ